MLSKDDLRKRLKKERSNTTDLGNNSIIITNKILDHPIYSSSKAILAYSPLQGEVDISKLIDHALEKGKELYLPMYDELKIGSIKDGIQVLPNGYKQPRIIIDPQNVNIDLIIVPALAFSRHGVRLGHGKGWYDRFISLYAKDAFKLGICISRFLIDDIPFFKHDIKVDAIITEKEIININNY